MKVGVIGLGMMGLTHLDVYQKRSDVQVVAISDKDADRLTGRTKAAGNVEGQAQGGFDYSSARQYDEGMKVIADKEIELVDICLPTPMHVEYAVAALKAGKHLLVEKPLGRYAKDAAKLVKASQKAKGMSMVAMCMRFWPGWTWLKQAVDQQTYGKVYAAHFRRVASHPGRGFYTDGSQCGGAILDLHIHDTDFIQYCFGIPQAVTSKGYMKDTSEIDHIVTHYQYENIPLVVAEGGWSMAPGFGFKMQYTVNFERATAIFDIGAEKKLMLVENGQSREIPLESKMGYELEIDYFLNCIKTGVKPATVTLESGMNSVKIIEAEEKSVKTGKTVKVKI